MSLTPVRSREEDTPMGLRTLFVSASGRANLNDPSLDPDPLGDLAEEFLERTASAGKGRPSRNTLPGIPLSPSRSAPSFPR